MPTAAKLFAALAFAMVAYYASETFIPLLPEGTQVKQFSLINAALGGIIGWRIQGADVGNGYRIGATVGLRGMAVFLFFAVGGYALREMLIRATKLRYDGPGEAIVGMFDLCVEYGRMTLTSPDVMGILILGAIATAWGAEAVNRRWS